MQKLNQTDTRKQNSISQISFPDMFRGGGGAMNNVNINKWGKHVMNTRTKGTFKVSYVKEMHFSSPLHQHSEKSGQ